MRRRGERADRRRRVRRALGLGLVLAVCGCSQLPVGPEPPARGGDPSLTPLCAALAPVRVRVAAGEGPKGYRVREVLDAEAVQETLRRWTEAAGVFARVRAQPLALSSEDTQALLDDAWRERDDVLLEVRLERFRVSFDGHNKWWVPNIVNWLFWMIPAWFVATEDYSLSCRAEWTLRSVGADRVVARGARDVRVQGSLDEFDRGWQFFGFIYPLNDADNWRQIARALAPAAVAEAGRALLEALRGPVRVLLASDAGLRRLSKRVAVLAGVSRYRSGEDLPPLPFAARDAQRVGEALVESGALPRRQVEVLLESSATLVAVERALNEAAQRLGPRDELLLYLAGYGGLDARGEPVVYLNAVEGRGELTFERLATLLAAIPAQKLVLFDLAFDGQERSLPPPRRRSTAAAQRALDCFAQKAGAAVVAAAGPGGGYLTSEALGASLFAELLGRALAGEADQDGDRVLTLVELYDFLAERVLAESAYFGPPQRVQASGIQRVRFELPFRSRPREANK